MWGSDIIRCKTSVINRGVVCYAHVSMAEVSWTCEQTICLCDVRTVLDKFEVHVTVHCVKSLKKPIRCTVFSSLFLE